MPRCALARDHQRDQAIQTVPADENVQRSGAEPGHLPPDDPRGMNPGGVTPRSKSTHRAAPIDVARGSAYKHGLSSSIPGVLSRGKIDWFPALPGGMRDSGKTYDARGPNGGEPQKNSPPPCPAGWTAGRLGNVIQPLPGGLATPAAG